MIGLYLRVGVLLLLAIGYGENAVAAGCLRDAACFSVSSLSADDAGGIYIGSIVTMNIVVKRIDQGIVRTTGQWQAALDIPSAFTYVDNNPCAGYFYEPIQRPKDYGSQPLIWPAGTDGNGAGDDLAQGASSSCQVRLRLNSIPSNPVATVTAYQNSFYGTANDVETYTFHVTSVPTTDMAIAIGASKTSIAVGDSVDYTLTASNQGRQQGTAVRTVFSFPTSLAVAPKNCPGASTTGGQAITWSLGTINYGTSATCVLTATALSGGGTNATVTANINDSGTTDPTPSNNSASNTIAIAAEADLAISIGTSAASVTVGSSVDYTLTASNLGPQAPYDARTTFSFPASLSVALTSCSNATISAQTLTWDAGSINSGASASCVLTATAQSGAGTNATVTAMIGDVGNCPGPQACGVIIPPTPDPNAANNTATKTIAIAAAQPQGADLAAAISASASSLVPGQNVTFTLSASNLGPATATSTDLTAMFATQLQLNSASCASGTPANPLTWNIGSLAAGVSKTCTVQATLNATSATTISASDSVSSATTDSNTGNNSARVTIAVQQPSGGGQPANLSVQLASSAPGHTYLPGDALQLSVTATNASSDADASGVTVTVHVPADGSLTGVSTTCGATGAATGDLVWSVGALARASSRNCTIMATVAAASRTIPVSASITAPALGPDLDSLNAAVLIPVSSLPKRISVTASGGATTKNSTHVALTHDGSKAVFESQETDLVSNNANTDGQDVYSVGTDGNAVLETLDSSGHQLIGTAGLPAISGDGSIVAFTVAPAAAKQAKDALTGQMFAGLSGQPKQQLDMGVGGAAPNGAVSGGPSVAVSADGSRKLVFCSAASNLVTGDSNGARDIFLVDPLNPAQAAQLISTDSSGKPLPGDSCEPAISADGTKVVFTTSAPSLFSNGSRQVVRKDLTTGALELISATTVPAGPGANGDSSEPTINADGSVIAFTSQASDMDSLGAPIGGQEVFVALAPSADDGAARLIKRARSGDGTIPNGASQHPQLSSDGTIVVMQISGTSFFAAAKQDSTPPVCGAVALTTNFFTPAPVGSSLCTNNGSVSNSNPTVSGDGTTTGFDSNAPQSGTGSNNSNAYTQALAGTNAFGVSNFSDDFSGQWYDPSQSGHGLVLDVFRPDADNNRTLLLTWFVYVNGEPTWVQGAGMLHAGSGDQAGRVVVQMNPNILHGISFPLGNQPPTITPWGSITLTFADANTGTMTWTSTYPGFNSGTMALTHFLPVALPAADLAGAQIKACDSGNWYSPGESGHGFEFEVLSGPPRLVVDWFAFSPTGAPVWLQGSAPINGNVAQVPLNLFDGAGAKFPPLFDASELTLNPWGTATFKFTSTASASVSWNSTIANYGSGTLNLVPAIVPGLLDRRGCD